MPDAATEAVPKLVAVYDDYAADTITYSQRKLLKTIGLIGTHPDVSIPLFQRVLREGNSTSNDALGPLTKIKAISDNERNVYLQQIAAAAILRLYPDKPKVITYCLGKMSKANNNTIRNLRSRLGGKLDNIIAIGKANPDKSIQEVAERLSEDPPEE